MRKRHIAIAVLLLLASLGAYSRAEFEQGKTGWELESLKGEVRSIRIEEVTYVERSGQWAEQDRKPTYANAYNRKGNYTEQVNYHSLVDKNHPFRIVCTYDSMGNRTEETSYNADGTLSGKSVYEYDSMGNQTKSASYKADGSLSGKAAITYDSMGNWTKRVNSKQVTKSGKTWIEPVDAEYRTIEYYK